MSCPPSRLLLGLTFATAALAACAHPAAPSPSTPSPSTPGPAPTARGGVRGTVTELAGDYMPPGPPAIPTPVAGARVHAFAAPHAAVERVDPSDPGYRGGATTDEQGGFTLALPPGRYHVVADLAGHLIPSCVEVGGRWCTIELGADGWRELSFTDTSRATF